MSLLSDRSPAAVIPAIEANLSLLWRSYSRLPGAELYDQPDLFWVATDIPFPPFNGVVRARLPAETIVPTITSTLQHFARRRVPMLWLIGPSTQPSDLGSHLSALGLTHMADDPGMAIDLHSLPTDLLLPSGFTSEAVAADRPDYTMTITAQRLPADCKGVAYERMSADCAAILDNATISVHRNR